MKYRSEHEEQCALIERVRQYEKKIPELRMLFAVPNGGKRHPRTAIKLKAEGVKAGVSDLILCCPSLNGKYNGLFIEMKSCNPKAKTSDKQLEWLTLGRQYGYAGFVCYGVDQAWEILLEYLGIDIKKA